MTGFGSLVVAGREEYRRIGVPGIGYLYVNGRNRCQQRLILSIGVVAWPGPGAPALVKANRRR
jgi:hypothetical protein